MTPALAPRRLVWQLALVIGFVSLAFVAGSLLHQRAEEDTHRQVQAAQTRVYAESLDTVVGLRGLTLRNYVADYSLWGDMAIFAAKGDAQWATTNVDASLATFKLSYAWVFDRAGAPRYHASSSEPLPSLPGAGDGVAVMLATMPFVHYFVRLADGTLVEVRGARIQREDDQSRTSEALGYFFAAMRWDPAYVEEFRSLTGGEPSIVDAGSSCSPPRVGAPSIVIGRDLPGRGGAAAARLCTRLPNASAELLETSSRDTRLASLAFAAALFATLAALLHVLVARPVQIIRRALSSGDVRGLARLQAQRNEFGELARAVVERQRGVEEREVLRAQVYQAGKLASLGVLGAGMAHELNNPLAAVLGHADMLVAACAAEPLDVDETRESAAVILAQAERMRGIVDHVRALSRAESGPPRLDPQDINGVVQDAVAFLRSHVDHRGITLTLRLAPDLPSVACDRIMVESIIQNLVLNATDELETLAPGLPRIIAVQTALDQERDLVVLRVADGGGGVPETAVDRIFEPFFTTKPVGKGTGLGLSLVHGMVQQHGGSVSFQTSSAGTTFEVALPPARHVRDSLRHVH